MSNIQKMVDKFNKTQVKEFAKEERKVKYSTILNRLKEKFVKSKQNDSSVRSFKDEQCLQEYKQQYEKFLKLS